MMLHMTAAVMAMMLSMMSRRMEYMRYSGLNRVKMMVPKAQRIEVMRRPAAVVT